MLMTHNSTISFKCNNPLSSLPKLNNCISDIRVWMIKNKLKINDSKIEFIVFRSPQAKQSLKSKRCYFHVILIISMISLLTDYNCMVIYNIHLYITLYRLNLYCVILFL